MNCEMANFGGSLANVTRVEPWYQNGALNVLWHQNVGLYTQGVRLRPPHILYITLI